MDIAAGSNEGEPDDIQMVSEASGGRRKAMVALMQSLYGGRPCACRRTS